MTAISGATLTTGVIGSPVRHSLSPALHNAAYDALGVDARSLAFPVAPGEGAAAVDAMRTLGIRGLSVTMPHKEAVLDAVDAVTPAVEALGAANCLVNDDGVVTAHNTDGDGFVRSLDVEHGLALAGRRVVVLGAGGAARSVVEAVGRHGAQVVVINRTPANAEAAVAVGGPEARVGTTDDLADADVIVNATSLGMHSDDDRPSPVDPLGGQHLVVDLIYTPLRSAWLDDAAGHGATTVNGVPMLLHQAAIQIEHWTGEAAPLDAMRAAVAAHIG